MKHNLLEELIKFAFAKRSEAMKAPERSCVNKMEGLRPDKFAFVE